MTWAPEDIKRFVIDQNKDKTVKKQMEMKRNQDIKTMIVNSNQSASAKHNLQSISTINSHVVGGQGHGGGSMPPG